MFSISPKNDKFFELFTKYSYIINNSAKMLKQFIEDPSDAERKFQEIKDVEHEGDEMLHSIFNELNNSFITPIDREDIFAIGKAMDDVIDFAEATASRFLMFNIKSSRKDAVIMGNLVLNSTNVIIDLMKQFKNMKNNKELSKKIVEINAIENEGDVTFRKAVKELFDGQHDTLEIITWKEIFESLENILDACEDVANIVEGVVMKHA